MSDLNIEYLLYNGEYFNDFCECINDFYMGGYPYKQFLNKPYLQQLIDSGDMILTLAIYNNDVVGTCAALRMHGSFENSILLLLCCVKSSARGNRVATNLINYLFEEINIKFPDALSLYADVMTHNNYSQKALLSRNFTMCGYRFMLYKNSIMVPKLNFAPGTKMTQTVFCKNCNVKEVNIFKPDEHSDFIFTLYKNLGVKCNFTTVDSFNSKDSSICENTEHLSFEIFLENDDFDFEKITALLNNGYTGVAYVNMNYAKSIEWYRILKGYKFRFSGIKPLSQSGEYLIMSNIDNCVNNFNDIAFVEENREISEYLVGGWNNE